MKKMLLAVSVVSAATSVGAQQNTSSVELYGLVDAGFTRVSGLRGGTITQMNSGIMEGSRWGLRGKEDLGGGYKAIMTLESRLEVDTGSVTNRPVTGTQLPDRLSTPAALGLPDTPDTRTAVTNIGTTLANADFGINVPGRFFDRQAFVGLVTPYGAVLVGRQYTPGFETVAAFDVMAVQSSLSATQIVAFPPAVDIRMSNVLAYRAELNGFSGTLAWAPGEAQATTGRYAAAGAMYKNERFSLGAAYNTRDNERGAQSLTSTVLGGAVNIGADVLTTLYCSFKDDHPSGLSIVPTTPLNFQAAFSNALRQDGKVFHIGYRHMFGANALSLAYTTYNDKRPANSDAASYGLAYTYVLSKRTDLSAILTHVDNKTAGQSAPGGNGYLGGVAGHAGQDVNSLGFGIRHRF